MKRFLRYLPFIIPVLVLLVICIVFFFMSRHEDMPKWMDHKFFRKPPAFFHPEKGDKDRKEEEDEGDGKHLKITLSDSGADIFVPNPDLSYDYRYGPSMIADGEGGIDAYFAAPGDGVHETDWITYRHSDDYGTTWSEEEAVLFPEPYSLDATSVCDPGAFYYNGYYYIGYTSSVDIGRKGVCNSVFVARSENPKGPFEKWNGTGWGEDPYPIIYYDGISIGWGCGEPSFVIKDGVLLVYVTLDSYSAEGRRVKATLTYSADAEDENWPENLSYQEIAVVRSDTESSDSAEYVYNDCDSLDVAYIEEFDKFMAVAVNRRFTDDSCLIYFESDDGYSFEKVSEINSNVYCGGHNCGILKDGQGHIKKDDKVMIGYAYSGSDSDAWGHWATRIAPAKIEETDEIDTSEESESNIKGPIDFTYASTVNLPATCERTYHDIPSDAGIEEIQTILEDYYVPVSSPYVKSVRPIVLYDSGDLVELDAEAVINRGITFKVVNEDVCIVGADGIITPVAPGDTTVALSDASGYRCKFDVHVSE